MLTQEEKDLALNLKKEGKSWKEVAEILKKDKDEIRDYIRTTSWYKENHTHHTPKIKLEESMSPTDFLKKAIEFQKTLEERKPYYREIDIEIDSDVPIILIDWADWHIGHIYCDYNKFFEDKELIKNTSNVYCVLNGDLTDNAIEHTHMGSGFEQLFTPKYAKSVVKDVVEELDDKILAVVLGDHDNWSEITDDFNPAEYYAHHAKSAWFQWGGIINLKVKNIDYKIAVRHRFYGLSRKNLSNPHENLWRETNADIIMLAHTHTNMIHQESFKERMKIFVNSGSYKKFYNWHDKQGYPESQSIFPAVILYPDEKFVMVMNDFKEAIKYLDL